MLVDHYSSILFNTRMAIISIIEPLEKISSLPSEYYTYLQQDFTSIESLKKENQDLETELFLLKAKQQKFNQLELEIVKLNNLLGKASQLSELDVQIANIIYYKLTPYSQSITLNKGSRDNVSIKQPVIDAYGLLGIITQTTSSTAKVKLITDADIQVPVKIQRTGQRGILKGIGQNKLYLQFISNSSSVKVGDLIETSGLANTYPKGQPIAKVVEIKTLKDHPYLQILTEPLAKISQAEKVLILSRPFRESNQ